jgi:tRNA-splicing ligase RtcB
MPRLADYGKPPVAAREYKNACQQLGTLGGGNHFIEIQRGDDGFIWIMIHSGSRNIGKQVADYYNKAAKKLNEKENLYPPQWDLAYLRSDTRIAQDYLAEMQYCVDFAFANRRLMIERVQKSVREVFGDVKFFPPVNIAHNYAASEEHFGEKVYVHRKGATSAKTGETGIIPGSQGAKSYIVEGLGNPDSFSSCSHGAGRVMGRRAARRRLDLKKEAGQLDSQGIIHSLRSPRDLDEAASCYKNISIVMKNQEDLVKIIHEMSPLAVVKG